MTTGKCYDCGKAERLHGCVRCADCHGQWLIDYMSASQLEERTPDHYVLPDDDSPDSQAGIGPFNFSFAFKNAEDIVLWHDLITKNNSFAARIGIPNWRVAQQFQIMLRRRNEELRKEGKISGMRGVFWNLSSLFVRSIHRLFYAGPLR